jgi:hypothetical protein|uniref:Uncharacterized protein n=1 Tax=viral metagenome TaxID=1070528 RepID=A0A6C0IIQ5_9ZZZZ
MSSLRIKTPHYMFDIMIADNTITNLHTVTIKLSSGSKICLDVIITLELLKDNNYKRMLQHTATIDKIEAHKDCLLDKSVSNDYMMQYSLGKELMNATLFLIYKKYPTITRVKLSDASNIHCKTLSEDKLDMLTYNIAVHKKTWYEQHFGAYIDNPDKYETYRAKVERYASAETKAGVNWIDLYNKIPRRNIYTREMFDKYQEKWKLLFESSTTFPEFFKAINHDIPREYKCRFYANWLNIFIESYIGPMIERNWYINIASNIESIRSNGEPTFQNEKKGGNMKKYSRKTNHTKKIKRTTKKK